MNRSEHPASATADQSPPTRRVENGVTHSDQRARHPGRYCPLSAATLARAGYCTLVVLALMLPFDFTQRPVIQIGFETITNVGVVLYAVLILATVYVSLRCTSSSRDRAIRRYLRQLPGPLSFFLGLLLCCLLSSLLSSARSNSLRWVVDVLGGSTIWLVAPLWLAVERERKIRLLVQAIVLGAAIASVAGMLEFWLGAGYAHSLSWFKPKETSIGPFLRLSGTFRNANVAAMYFELALPLAVAGLFDAAVALHVRWRVVSAWAVAVVVLLEGIVLTFSRGGLLGLAAAVAATVVIWRRCPWPSPLTRKQRNVLVTSAILAVVAGMMTLLSTPPALLRFTSESDQQWYAATFDSRVPSTLAACQQLTVTVTVANRSPFVWQPRGVDMYNLGYHWLFPSGKVAIFENPRIPLPATVQPGHTQVVRATIRTPGRAGRYLLVWDMVQHDVTWFSLQSASYVGHPVRVLGAASRALVCSSGVEGSGSLLLSGPPDLPRTFSQPGRTRLWAAALRMVEARPLLGVGPDDFRLRYGAFTEPPLTRWDKRILTNNLYLELLADLGILGAALFLGFLSAVWWPLVRAVWAPHGQAAGVWQTGLVAAFAAFLAHGLVDVFLDSQAITLMLWLLCGLASAMGAGRDPTA